MTNDELMKDDAGVPAADRAQVSAVRFRDGQRDAPSGEQFDTLQPQPQGVHGVLGVIAVHRHQFGPVGVRLPARS